MESYDYEYDYSRLYSDEKAKNNHFSGEILVLRDRIERLCLENASLKASLSERNNEIMKLNRVNAILESEHNRR